MKCWEYNKCGDLKLKCPIYKTKAGERCWEAAADLPCFSNKPYADCTKCAYYIMNGSPKIALKECSI